MPQAAMERTSRMKPRIIASKPEISITTSRKMSRNVTGICALVAARAVKRAVYSGLNRRRHRPFGVLNGCFGALRDRFQPVTAAGDFGDQRRQAADLGERDSARRLGSCGLRRDGAAEPELGGLLQPRRLLRH